MLGNLKTTSKLSTTSSVDWEDWNKNVRFGGKKETFKFPTAS